MIGECSAKTKTMTSMYALGWTQHSKGSQNIRAMAMLQLILGNIGVRGGGMNALRGHSNIQGLTDIGLMSNLIPGYLTIPTEREPTLDSYMKTRGFKPLRPNQMSYWQNYKKFFVSFQKSMWGNAATAENNWAYDYLPKLDVPGYDVLRVFDMMHQGKMNGYICQGFNPLLSFPNRTKCTAALAKLKFLIVMDPLQTETARFWQNHGEFNDVDTPKISTEVIELPTTCFAEDTGALVNSGRWLQWHWAGGTPPGEAKSDVWIMSQIYLRLKALYEKEGGPAPEPITKLVWAYKDPKDPTPDEIAKEINGYVVADVPDPNDPTKMLLQKGKQVPAFAALRDDGSTAAGCWIYTGCYTEAGNQMARRDNSDPDDTGAFSKWAFSWPANRRILYNRASADVSGQPWDQTRKLIWWDGAKWTGYDVPDIAPTAKPGDVQPFIMNPEGTARLFTRGLMRDGPFPAHYRAIQVTDRQPGGAEGARQSCCPCVQGRHGAIRRREGVPLCGDLLSSHRALPLLDQTLSHERRDAAGVFRRNRRRAREGKGHQVGRLGPRLVKAWIGESKSGGHQAHLPHQVRRQAGPHRRHSAALGIHGSDEEGLRPEFADALRR